MFHFILDVRMKLFFLSFFTYLDRAALNQKITDLANEMEKCVDDYVKKHRGNETLYTDLNVYIKARPNTNPSGFSKQVRVYA